MPGLAATGTLSYNDVEFTGAYHVSAEVQCVLDDAGRHVIAHRIMITVETIIADDDTDGELETIRFKMGQSGRVLIFKNKGFGDDLVINKGRVRDIDNGPKPEVMSWTPVGNNRAAEVVWRVTVVIPPCKYARYRGIKQLTWGAQWSIDRIGDTTRILSGAIEIVGRGYVSDVGGRAHAITSADQYRDWFAPRPIRGFTREQTWTMAPSKDRIEFSITDTQVPSRNPYPEHVPVIDAKHRVGWRKGRNQLRLNNVLTATITPKHGMSGSLAWTIFATLVGQRADIARRKKMHPFLVALDIEEDIFGREHSFRAGWYFLSSIDQILKSDLIKTTGLWRPIGTSWDKWAMSLSDSQFHNRGHAKLFDRPADDIVVDLCTGQSVVSPNNAKFDRYISPVERVKKLKNRKPDPKYSWFEYDHMAIPYRDTPTTRQPHLQDPENTSKGGFNFDRHGIPLSDSASYGQETGSHIPDTISVGGAPSYSVTYVGRAMRAGHKIPRPYVETIGNQPATEISNQFAQYEVANYFGVRVYAARWAISYVLPSSPGRVPVPINQTEVA